VVVKVRVFGTTLGGEDVESAELLFPIEVCDGCLVSFPSSDLDPAVSGTQCKRAADMDAPTSTETDSPCNLGIDFPVSCTACSNLYAACQTPTENCAYTSAACDHP
jgi:hypothetical protein